MEEKNIIWLEENSLYLLFRRGKSEHIKALYEEGEVYLNTIDFIRKCDINAERSDPYDGIAQRLFLGNVEVKMCNVGKDIDKDGISLNAVNCTLIEDSVQKGNIFCMSGIFSHHLSGDRKDINFDTKSFGESMILIYNPKEFISRIVSALHKEGYKDTIFQRVSYYPNEFSGPVGLFRKHERFSGQSEARLFVPNSEDAPIKIKIGSLSDIACIEGNTLLQLTYTDGKIQVIRLE